MFNQAAYSDSENPANTRLFETGWGVVTFAEMMELVTPIARSAFLRYNKGITFEELEDMLQRGLTVLWRRLLDDPQLLVNSQVYTASAIVIANRGERYEQRKHFDLLLGRPDEPTHWEDYLLGEWERERPEVWAGWASRADLRLDITRILQGLANEYLARPRAHRYLCALYYLTTSVENQYIKQFSGVVEINLRPFILEVRRDLRAAFAELYPPTPGWWDKYQRGHTAPAEQVLQQYAQRPFYPAIQWLLAGAPSEQRHHLKQCHINRARRALERAYHTNH